MDLKHVTTINKAVILFYYFMWMSAKLQKSYELVFHTENSALLVGSSTFCSVICLQHHGKKLPNIYRAALLAGRR